MNKELKPCPFCGGDVYIEAIGRDWYCFRSYHEENCILKDALSIQVPQTEDQRELLKDDWNTRA